MTIRVAINGFGRIGRLVFRALHSDPRIDIRLINDLYSAEVLVNLLKYDSVHGPFKGKLRAEGNFLVVDQKRCQVTAESDPERLPYKELGVDVVIESTGHFTKMDAVKPHLRAGATKVIITAPSSDAPMFVIGVNEARYDPDEHHIVSNASCTTNCLAPLIKVIHEKFVVVEAFMTTIHAATPSNKVGDVGQMEKYDKRDGRSIINNIIPSSTGAAVAVGKVIPELMGKLTGMAFRVPISDVSVVDLTVRVAHGTSYPAICQAIKEAADGPLKGILGYTEDAVVSSDFIGNPLSCIFDILAGIELNSHFYKLIAWYDNEWGYANRVVDLLHYMMNSNKTLMR